MAVYQTNRYRCLAVLVSSYRVRIFAIKKARIVRYGPFS